MRPAPSASPSSHTRVFVDPPTRTAPLARDYQLIHSDTADHLFAVDGSRLFDLDEFTARSIESTLSDPQPSTSAREALQQTFGDSGHFIDGSPLQAPPLRSLSLNVAQSCNLACGYCYADEGRFGGNARLMDLSTAKAAVDRLISESSEGDDIVIGFMGGEPLINAPLIHATTHYASDQCAAQDRRARFSITTNATLVSDKDAALFREHRFSVAVSVDGTPLINDKLRPTRRGDGSYAAFCQGLSRILDQGGPGHVSARITVVPESNDLLTTLKHVLALGVGDAGFAPVQVSPQPKLAFESHDFSKFLAQMIDCGEFAKSELRAGRRFPFSNFETALNEIHRGSHRPYPCGAAAAYMSVNADGKLYACHRLVDQEDWLFGDVSNGIDNHSRQQLLNRKHVDQQQPCRDCWARYLCGGGCYHEVEKRGRQHCDYVRGWLRFCIAAYAELSSTHPDYFVNADDFFACNQSQNQEDGFHEK